MRTEDVRLGAFLVTKGYPILAIGFTPRGFAILEFPPDARAEESAYLNDAPAPARSLLKSYKLILKRIDEERTALRVLPREVASRG